MIYTSYFANVKSVLGKKPNIRFCSIAGKTPDWFLELDKNLNLKSFKCKALAPHYDWWRLWKDKFKDNLESTESKNWYIKAYYESVLKFVDAHKLTDMLYSLSLHHDICLLCYETSEKFCHRHIVAEWLNNNGIECSEI